MERWKKPAIKSDWFQTERQLKKWFNYIKLYGYFAFNWNPVLAGFILLHEIRGEKKFENIDLLVKQINEDVGVARKLFTSWNIFQWTALLFNI